MASMRTRQASARVLVLGLGLCSVLVAGAVRAQPLVFQNGTATCSQAVLGTYSVDQAVDGVLNNSNGWAIYCNGTSALAETAVFETQVDVNADRLTFVFHQTIAGPKHTIGKFRLSATAAARNLFADGADNNGALGDGSIWTVLDPISAVSTGGATLTEQVDHSILASGTSPDTAVYTVVAPTPLSNITGIRIELLEDASLPFNGPGRETQTGNLVLSEMTAEACSFDLLDVDDDAAIGPLTDALLLLRYTFGFRDATLVSGVLGGDCERCLADNIETYLASIQSIKLDVDGDGAVGALTDVLLILRYAFGFRGPTLISGAVDADCERCLAPEIEAFLACAFLAPS